MPDSTPESIAAALRDDLLNGELEPGSRLTEESLVTRFGSGRHSVRAALRLLAAEGLLEHRRNRGIIVPDVTPDRVAAMNDYRAILELGALRLALERGADFAPAIAAVEHLESLGPDTSWRQLMEAHSAVHRRIVEAGGNSRLSAAHAACDNELNAVLAIVKGDFTAHELATLHRQLVTQLLRGGDEAVRALEKDLQLGGSSAMRRAHADDAATA